MDKRRRCAAAFVCLVGLIALLATVAYGGPNARAANVNISLYGTTLGGWGTAPGTETNPGPTLMVALGDRVTMALTSEDVPTGHAFWIDYDNDGVIDLATEPSSTEFTSTIVYTFDATVSGTFTYYCSIHSGPPYSPTTSLMRGTWITARPPSIAITAPISTTSWSGGVPHGIVFNLASADPPASLSVWVNYSYSAGTVTGPVIGPISGGPNPNVVSWTPTGFGATDVTIDVTAVDSAGRRGITASPLFEVDSAAPTVLSTVPSSGSTGIPLNSQIAVTWSEAMNRVLTGSAASFGVARSSDGVWISGTIGWSSDSMQMTFTPAALLEPSTTYRAHVNGTAKDDSDPGNAVGAEMTWLFTTGQDVDVTPPSNASPDLTTVALVTTAVAIPSLAGYLWWRRRRR